MWGGGLGQRVPGPWSWGESVYLGGPPPPPPPHYMEKGRGRGSWFILPLNINGRLSC